MITMSSLPVFSSTVSTTALNISSALTTSIVRTNGGFSMEVSPVISTTSAPLCAATFAMAYPILPVEWLVIYLTGSIASFVGPAVTTTLLPVISFSNLISLKIC